MIIYNMLIIYNDAEYESFDQVIDRILTLLLLSGFGGSFPSLPCTPFDFPVVSSSPLGQYSHSVLRPLYL